MASRVFRFPVPGSAFAAIAARAPLPRSGPAGRSGRRIGGGRGQSLVEFAISAPVLLLMILFGVDFGRVFLGWVTLSNAAREAANFAALNPTAWTAPGSVAAQTEFDRLINAESSGINCTLPNPLPDPSFPGGTDIGSPAVVAITCQFSIITPIISNIIGGSVPVSVSAAFPIRSGAISGIPAGGALPTPGPTRSSTATPIPTPSGIATPVPTPTPVPVCSVPNLKNVTSSAATGIWTGQGFAANNLTFNPLVPPHYTIKNQTLTKNTSVPCTSAMTVSP